MAARKRADSKLSWLLSLPREGVDSCWVRAETRLDDPSLDMFYGEGLPPGPRAVAGSFPTGYAWNWIQSCMSGGRHCSVSLASPFERGRTRRRH